MPNSSRRTHRGQVWARDRGVCAICFFDTKGITAETRQEWEIKPNRTPWEVDHRVPIVEGGPNQMANLRTLCVPCHRGETAKLLDRMYEPPSELETIVSMGNFNELDTMALLEGI